MKILVVGQTPPPYGGQAVMIQLLLNSDLRPFELHHVRMAFSRNMGEIGHFKPGKVLELLRVVGAVITARFRTGARVLYYPPAGPDTLPILRDTVILLATRWLFERTVFHFHAGGAMDHLDRSAAPLRHLARLAYRRPDLTIRTAETAPEDGKACGSRCDIVVPNGVEDLSAYGIARAARVRGRLLFVGVLCEDKGVGILIEAAGRLRARGLDFELALMGAFEPPDYARELRAAIAANDLEGRVAFLGVLSGRDKAAAFAAADVFCFPSYFASETSGLVLIEAMSLGLPVVATRWRGIPSVVKDGVEGFLVPIRDAGATAERIEHLLRDEELRRRMGNSGRETFERRFTRAAFVERMRAAFALLPAGRARDA